MDDPAIWGLVAFLRQLLTLSADDYDEAVEHSGGHAHAGAESAGHDDDHEHGAGQDHRTNLDRQDRRRILGFLKDRA